MTGERGIPDPRTERRRDPHGVHQESWSRTLETMEQMAHDRQDDGWEVVTVMAAHTDVVSRDMGDHNRFGLTHIIPNNHVDRFTDTFDTDLFTDYRAYGSDVEGFKYVVLELVDLENERSIMIACRYDMTLADGMVSNARDEGVLYSHIKKIDGTILGTFAHDDFEPLVTHADKDVSGPKKHLSTTQAWKATTEDLEAIAADRRDDDWDVVTIIADRTEPVASSGDGDRTGLVHTIPEPTVSSFEQAYDRGVFPEYLAYRNEVQSTVFLVTEFIDPDHEVVILIAGRYDGEQAGNTVESATEDGRIHSFIEDQDGNLLGKFEHEDPWPLLPSETEESNVSTTDT